MATPEATPKLSTVQTAPDAQSKTPMSEQNAKPGAALPKTSTAPEKSPVQKPVPAGGQTPLMGNHGGTLTGGLGNSASADEAFLQMMASGMMGSGMRPFDPNAYGAKEANERAKQKAEGSKANTPTSAGAKKHADGFAPNTSNRKSARKNPRQMRNPRESQQMSTPNPAVGKKSNGFGSNSYGRKGAEKANYKANWRQGPKINTSASALDKKNGSRQPSPVDNGTNKNSKTASKNQQHPTAQEPGRQSPDPFQSHPMEAGAKDFNITFPKDQRGRLLKQATASSRPSSPTPDHNVVIGAGRTNVTTRPGSAEGKKGKDTYTSGSSNSETSPSSVAPVNKPTQTPNNRANMSTKSGPRNENAPSSLTPAATVAPSDSSAKRQLFRIEYTPQKLTEEQKEESRRQMAQDQQREQALWGKPTPGIEQNWDNMPLTLDRIHGLRYDGRRSDKSRIEMMHKSLLNQHKSMETKDKKLHELESKVAWHESSLAQYAEQISEQSKDLEIKEKQIAEMRKQLDGDKQAITKRESHINSSEENTARLEEELRTACASAEAISKEKRALAKQLADRDEEASQLRKENEKLTEETRRAQERIARAEEVKKELHEEVFRKSVNNDEQKLKDHLANSQKQLAVVNQELEDAKAEIRSLVSTIDKLENEKQKMSTSDDSDQETSQNTASAELDGIFTQSDEEAASAIMTPAIAIEYTHASIQTDAVEDETRDTELATPIDVAPEVLLHFVDNFSQTIGADVQEQSTQTTETESTAAHSPAKSVTADAAVQTEDNTTGAEEAGERQAAAQRFQFWNGIITMLMMICFALVVYYSRSQERKMWLRANDDSRRRVIELTEEWWGPPHWWKVVHFRLIEWLDVDRVVPQ